MCWWPEPGAADPGDCHLIRTSMGLGSEILSQNSLRGGNYKDRGDTCTHRFITAVGEGRVLKELININIL